MPTIPVHPPSPTRSTAHNGGLPNLLRTPLGYALLELQGTINFTDTLEEVKLGRVTFPDYDPAEGAGEGPWMRKVYLYIGHQRMTGEIQKLKKPLGLLRRRSADTRDGQGNNSELIDSLSTEANGDARGEELEITEILYYKLVFRSRPEPVGLAGD